MPDAAALESISKALRDEITGIGLETTFHRGQATLVIGPERNLDVLEWLRTRPEWGYSFLASLHGADYLPRMPRFAVHYQLLDMERAERIAVKVVLNEPQEQGRLPELASCVEIFPTAEFQEREVYDMFGIVFTGHPDLRRILMPEEYEGWPQRRDFPIGGEPVQFSFNESEIGGA